MMRTLGLSDTGHGRRYRGLKSSGRYGANCDFRTLAICSNRLHPGVFQQLEAERSVPGDRQLRSGGRVT